MVCVQYFFRRGGGAFLQGVLRKHGGCVWCFDGAIVVECVVKMVGKTHQISCEKCATFSDLFLKFSYFWK
jgi:hypothetical protein